MRGLAFALLALGCHSKVEAPPEDASPGDTVAADVAAGPPVLAFVGTVTGKVHVVDVTAMADRLTIAAGHSAIHGTAVMPDKVTIYTMNYGESRVDKRKLASDLSDAPVVLSIPVKAPPTFLTRSPDARFIATGATDSAMHGGVPVRFQGQEVATFIATETDAIVLALPLETPAAVLYAPDASRGYVLAQKSREIPVVDLKTLTVVETWVVAERTDNDFASGRGAVRASDGVVCVSNMEHHNVSCLDPKAPSEQWLLDSPELVPHDMSFDAVGRLWVQAADHRPDAGHEAEATTIASAVLVFDVEARTIVKELAWDYSIWHVKVGPNGRAYVSGSWGTVVIYDTTDFSLVAAVSLASGPEPVMSVDF